MKRLSFLLAVPLLFPLWDVVGPSLGAGRGSALVLLGQGAPDATTTGTTEQTLITVPIPAGTLSMDGDTIMVMSLGHTANNNNNKRWRIKVGGTLVYDSTANPWNDSNFMWYTPAIIQRRTGTTATVSASGHGAPDGVNLGLNAFYQSKSISPIDWTIANDLTITGETPTAAGDLTVHTYSVWVLHGGPSSGTPIAILGQGAPLKATSGTAEEVLATIPIPSGSVSTNGATVSLVSFYHTPISANNKRIRVRVGGIGGTIAYDTGNVTWSNHNAGPISPLRIQRTGATTATSQMRLYIGQDGAGITSATYYSDRNLAVTWANPQDLTITGQTAVAGELTLDTYMGWLMK